MQKIEINISESSASLYDRANHAIGTIKAALLAAGVATVVSDNDPAPGSVIYRNLIVTFLGTSRKIQFLALVDGTSWSCIIDGRNTANTGNLSGLHVVLFSTNTTTAKVFLLFDSKSLAIKGLYQLYPLQISYNRAGGGLASSSTASVYIDGVDTPYSITNPINLNAYLCSDGATSMFMAAASLTNASRLWLKPLGDMYVPDNSYWTGVDKFGCTDGQLLEITTGNYLIKIGTYSYFGYIE